jgi:hypothetical protein
MGLYRNQIALIVLAASLFFSFIVNPFFLAVDFSRYLLNF